MDSGLTTVLTTTMTTVRLPDTSTYTTSELVLCLVAQSACADGSEGWGFESLRARAAHSEGAGTVKTTAGYFLLVCELPDPGRRVEIGVGGQGSGGARPRKRPQGLDGDGVRRTLFRTGKSKRLVLLSACGTRGVGVVFRAGFPAWGRRGLRGHSFAAMCGMKRVRRGTVGRGQSEGTATPVTGFMSCTTRADREPCAHAACGERCRARTWWSRSA